VEGQEIRDFGMFWGWKLGVTEDAHGVPGDEDWMGRRCCGMFQAGPRFWKYARRRGAGRRCCEGGFGNGGLEARAVPNHVELMAIAASRWISWLFLIIGGRPKMWHCQNRRIDE
jgi:hypothetical protein